MGKVSFAESNLNKGRRAVEEFTSHGFALVTGFGYAQEDIVESPRYGLLHCLQPQWRKVWGFIPKRVRRDFIAEIHIERFGADNKQWVIEVFGREYVDKIRSIAATIAEKYSVDIHVRLDRERPKAEFLKSDFVPCD